MNWLPDAKAMDPAERTTRHGAGRSGVCIVLLLVWHCALAAPAGAAPKFEDTIAQRVQACTGCHGPQGRAATDGYYPRIAGKPPVYL